MPNFIQTPAQLRVPLLQSGKLRARRAAGRAALCALLMFSLCLSCVPRPFRAGPAQLAPRGFRQVPIGIGEDYPKEARSPGRVKRDLELLKAKG